MEDSSRKLGSKLSELRKARKMSQQEVAKLVSVGSDPISNRAVSKWETGDTLPNAEQFLALCRIYDIRDVLSTFLGMEGPNDEGLNSLNKLGRERVDEYISLLKESPEFSYKQKVIRIKRQMPLYDLPASAGTGVFLDSDSYTLIDVDETVPENANLAVRISGDSMTPLYTDGQIVYVRQQPDLKPGEIGIFVLNGEAYCKKLETDGGIKLISLNPNYKPIKVKYSYELRVIGKVVG
ncbi:MAG: helix-turn-helix domain-containing protein [Eubacteriales bacterium]|nr:helix-turn-helix domain-containing protein [Eubacteriales bacterium]MCI7779159.1 XRE family transcriptional regulator [Clostridiales bacterium]MDD6017484.1 XRE family transcriptional regulator [Clostridiales bacterium]MDD7488396.1 XRE family transcriptional regulator [Clostridiales bacterium]MDD7523063.1 XRE family transcriptional regulator [Clostridiales bacterium]